MSGVFVGQCKPGTSGVRAAWRSVHKVSGTDSGAATSVAADPFSPAIDIFEVHFGMGFDPATERIRLMVAEPLPSLTTLSVIIAVTCSCSMI